MSPTLPQPAPLQAQTLEAGKGLARLAQAEQPLDRGSVLSHLGTGLHPSSPHPSASHVSAAAPGRQEVRLLSGFYEIKFSHYLEESYFLLTKSLRVRCGEP